jgi:uncharacterized protein (TIGR03435 family)
MIRAAHKPRTHIRVTLPLALSLAVSCSMVRAQSTAPQNVPESQPQIASAEIPTFEVISIRQDKTAPGWRESITADGYSAHGITLKLLLMEAYGIRPDYRIIGAPGWSDKDRYDVEAKVADSDVAALQKLDAVRRSSMLQKILTDRFKLQAHRENRPQPIYSLIVVKKALLAETRPSPEKPALITRGRPGQFTATNLPISQLVAQLSGIMSRMVIDNTGLTGRYEIKLDWTPDDVTASSSPPPGASAPSIFTALQEQLGLKLVPTTGPVEVLVVDHVELPSEN